jgi:hypothetical protein
MPAADILFVDDVPTAGVGVVGAGVVGTGVVGSEVIRCTEKTQHFFALPTGCWSLSMCTVLE